MMATAQLVVPDQAMPDQAPHTPPAALTPAQLHALNAQIALLRQVCALPTACFLTWIALGLLPAARGGAQCLALPRRCFPCVLLH